MRVALSFSGCNRRGGVERVMLECANFLQSRGHETHAYASDWDERYIDPAVIRHHVPVRMNPSVWHIPAFAAGSRKALRQMDPAADVLGSFGVHSPPGGVMWVQSVHKAWLKISGNQREFKGRLKQRCNPFHPVILAFERHYFGGRRYRKLVALSQTVKQDLMEFYNVPGQDIVIIPNGFAPSEFNLKRRAELRDSMRQELGYSQEDKVVIFVANELERKGFGPLLRAIASLQDPNVRLLAVGRLSADSYASEIARLKLTSHVKFTGPTSDVAKYYSAADLFALPTQYEAWGLVIVEAMACGLPALTSRLAGASIVIQEGSTGGLLEDPNSPEEVAAKLRPLIAGRHSTSEAISQSVADYSWSKVLLRYEQVLSECRN
jgi:UDP-glucose:(heptosyl)LPS alpha-1,3-glucosyltransferase